MKAFTTAFIFSLVMTAAYGQSQFSVVCNTRTQQLEVIVMGQEQDFHRVLRDNFPNQRVAQAYLDEHAATLPCGPVQQPAPAPSPPPVVPSPVNGQQPPVSPTPLRGKPHYDRTFRLGAALSILPNLESLYGNRVETFSQVQGYNLGFDLTFGQTVKGGFGLHYTGLFGVFEEMVIDREYDFYDLYGYLKAAKGELLLRAPFQVAANTWGIIDFGMGYYFAIDQGVDEDLAPLLIPEINKGFLGFRWGAGVDLNRFILQFDGELIMGVSHDFDGNLLVLRFGIGYGF